MLSLSTKDDNSIQQQSWCNHVHNLIWERGGGSVFQNYTLEQWCHPIILIGIILRHFYGTSQIEKGFKQLPIFFKSILPISQTFQSKATLTMSGVAYFQKTLKGQLRGQEQEVLNFPSKKYKRFYQINQFNSNLYLFW